jgi:superfamily I DNA and/or RNA helicase
VGEAGLVVLVVKTLINAGVNPEDIGIITPYNAQVRLLKLSLSPSFPNLEIGSVDKLQGREKEAIVAPLLSPHFFSLSSTDSN